MTHLTPSEEIGLAGLRLANRVQRALDAIAPDEMKARLQEIHELSTARHLFYQHGGITETIRLFPCPLTLRPDQVGYTHYVSVTLLNCLKRLPDLYLKDLAVHEILRLTPPEEEWLRACWNPTHRENNPMFARLDAVVDYTSPMWKDSLKFMEPNLTGIGGAHLGPTADHILAEVMVPALMARDSKLKLQFLADIRQLWLQDLLEHLEVIGRRYGQIVLVDPKYDAEGPDEPDALAQYFGARHDVPVLHADPGELRLDGDEVYYEETRVDVAYRDYSVLDLLDLAGSGADLRPMRALFEQNRIISSIAAELDQKSCWEVLTTPELADRYFTAEERQVARRHVLWTRILADRRTSTPTGEKTDLLAYVRRERESLVLKPNRSYGGQGVVVGTSVNQADWESALETALRDRDDRWVVQQVATLPVKEFHVLDENGNLHLEPFHVVLGFAPSRYGVAMIARASQKQVVNVAQRGGICGVMVSASPVPRESAVG